MNRMIRYRSDLYTKGQSLVPDINTPEGHEDVSDPAGAAEDREEEHHAHEDFEVCSAPGHLAPPGHGLRDGVPGLQILPPGLLYHCQGRGMTELREMVLDNPL